MSAGQMGRIAGTLIALLLPLGLGIMWATRRRARNAPNWWLPIAGAIGLVILMLGGLVAQRSREQADPETILVSSDAVRYEDVPAEVQQQVESSLDQQGLEGAEAVARIATVASGDRAVVVVFAGAPGEADREGFVRGFAEASGAHPAEVAIRGHTVTRMTVLEGGVRLRSVLWVHRNLYILVQGQRPGTVRRVTADLLDRAPPTG